LIGNEEQSSMSTIRALKPRPFASNKTIADLLRRLGNIPAGRVRLHPMPGTADEKDVIRVLDEENQPCELVKGTLVEKASWCAPGLAAQSKDANGTRIYGR
jgi:hypothetical protein